MQLFTVVAASAVVATASAASAVQLNSECNLSKAHAKVVNRCSYPVHIWSVLKSEGCPTGSMVTLQTGEVYNENLQLPPDGVTGISIKMSKSETCGGSDITQLEYFLQTKTPGFNNNYLDLSYIDCPGGDCPSKSEGFHLIAGNQTTGYASSAGNTWCPILACGDSTTCATMAYIHPNDVQTKTCALDQNLELYLCGSQPPSDSPSSVASSSSQPTSASSTSDNLKVNAAAITNAPELPVAAGANIYTQVDVVTVVTTKYVNANAKRHAHGHARRHQRFHA